MATTVQLGTGADPGVLTVAAIQTPSDLELAARSRISYENFAFLLSAALATSDLLLGRNIFGISIDYSGTSVNTRTFPLTLVSCLLIASWAIQWRSVYAKHLALQRLPSAMGTSEEALIDYSSQTVTIRVDHLSPFLIVPVPEASGLLLLARRR
ncbi:MAG: hypothetical protein U1D30_21920 [Planctomycetota bacterium]